MTHANAQETTIFSLSGYPMSGYPHSGNVCGLGVEDLMGVHEFAGQLVGSFVGHGSRPGATLCNPIQTVFVGQFFTHSLFGEFSSSLSCFAIVSYVFRQFHLMMANPYTMIDMRALHEAFKYPGRR